ncbi:hypothetical protein AMTR_s00091p00086330 [Amborella trichopoda]|uniref:Uncharacterized protein n=1 Tax=Amborella trichopoda TaxID=13333 RepID=W1NTA6_AMBTC|nr:hypothetical protein AMTR_s00091p00086330 [Amborella trichopoda]
MVHLQTSASYKIQSLKSNTTLHNTLQPIFLQISKPKNEAFEAGTATRNGRCILLRQIKTYKHQFSHILTANPNLTDKIFQFYVFLPKPSQIVG